MKWLKSNWTTLAMAATLSLLTVGLLTKPGESNPPVTLTARFLPEVKAQVGSVEYWVDDKKYTTEIPVKVAGDKEQIQVISLTCQPILDEGKFPSDPAIRETTYEITAKDFNLTSELANRIRIWPLLVKITYAPMINKVLPVDVSPEDISDAKDAGVRINSIRAFPSEIGVRLPVDKANTLKSVKIRPIRIAGRNAYFETEGRINRDLPDFKDVSTREAFVIGVDLSPIPFQSELAGVPLFLSCSPIPGLKAELIDRATYKVVLDGPKNEVEKVRPEQVHVYVKLDWTAETQAGSYMLPVRCELADEKLRKLVRVELVRGEPLVAAVQVTRS